MHDFREEDMRRAALLHEAFLAYMRSTSAATGIPLPSSFYNGTFVPSQSGDCPQMNQVEGKTLKEKKVAK